MILSYLKKYGQDVTKGPRKLVNNDEEYKPIPLEEESPRPKVNLGAPPPGLSDPTKSLERMNEFWKRNEIMKKKMQEAHQLADQLEKSIAEERKRIGVKNDEELRKLWDTNRKNFRKAIKLLDDINEKIKRDPQNALREPKWYERILYRIFGPDDSED